jgi:ceramide glucosyltransferase
VGILLTILGTLAATSASYFAVAAVCSLFAARRRTRETAALGPRPKASVLIPLAGHEHGLRQNLEAALRALGEGDELILGAADPRDPALETAALVQRGSPDRVVVVSGSTSTATNRKVAALEAMSERARRGVIVLVDSDVRLDRVLLDRLVAPTAREGVGLSTALYRGVPRGGLASRLEALAINADFVPSVLVARALAGKKGLGFALGAANAVRREALDAIGGFKVLGPILADDHELGRRVTEAGFAVEIAPAVVPIGLSSTLRETLSRLLRWCRTYRVCKPAGYAATIVSHHGIAAALALAIAARFEAWALGVLAGIVAWRMATAAVAHVAVAGLAADLASLPLLPLRDLLATALFAWAWTGRSVTWRGRHFRVERDGSLRSLDARAESNGRPLAEALADAKSSAHGEFAEGEFAPAPTGGLPT